MPPLVMGVLNVTPDSFSDGGDFAGDPAAAAAAAEQMVADGADLIDVGGESTRPGSAPVPADEQIRRVVPVLRQIVARVGGGVVISVDTTRATVAAAAIDAGASVVNDVSAGRDDPVLLTTVAVRHVPLVLMHMLGTPATMQRDPAYADVTAEVTSFLLERLTAARAAGVAPHNLIVDPGIGFGKTLDHNLTLLRRLPYLAAATGVPVLVGTSRKKFVGTITGEPVAKHRAFGTAATVAWAVANGAALVRVHDVRAMTQVVKMTRAIIRGEDK